MSKLSAIPESKRMQAVKNIISQRRLLRAAIDRKLLGRGYHIPFGDKVSTRVFSVKQSRWIDKVCWVTFDISPTQNTMLYGIRLDAL